VLRCAKDHTKKRVVKPRVNLALGLQKKIMSNTPLSDKITALINESSTSLINNFELEFLNSQIGLVMKGLHQENPGEQIVVDGSGTVTCSLVSDPEGNPMIKACADPEVFESNYNEGINALMSGIEVLEMLIKIQNAKGILVCSATSFNSFPIYRERVDTILSNNVTSEPNEKKQWWKLW
jgi:hypothetical protein